VSFLERTICAFKEPVDRLTQLALQRSYGPPHPRGLYFKFIMREHSAKMAKTEINSHRSGINRQDRLPTSRSSSYDTLSTPTGSPFEGESDGNAHSDERVVKGFSRGRTPPPSNRRRSRSPHYSRYDRAARSPRGEKRYLNDEPSYRSDKRQRSRYEHDGYDGRDGYYRGGRKSNEGHRRQFRYVDFLT
jgi:hypothetical protein